MNTDKITELTPLKRNTPTQGGGKKIMLSLPIEAVERLIISYYRGIEGFYTFWHYFNSVCSRGMFRNRTAEQMLENIAKQLKAQGIDGNGLLEEIFVTHFKKSCDQMKSFSEKHGNLPSNSPFINPDYRKKQNLGRQNYQNKNKYERLY